MVKTKKKDLTPEERLAEALVPEDEQPYVIPENWVWTQLPRVCEYIRAGGDKPKNFSETKTTANNIPVVANGINNDGIVGYTDVANEKKNTVTISGRGTIGFSVLRDYPYYPIVRLLVIAPNRATLPQFLKLAFDNFLEEGVGSSIPQLTVPMLKDKIIPLPPLPEQHRIVERIESLFEKLDRAKELVQTALDSFETRKAAILHKTFTGELTAKWREENGVGMESWEETTLEHHVSRLGDGIHGTPQYNDDGNYYFINGNNLSGFSIEIKPDTKRVNETEYLKHRKELNNSTVLVSINGTLGKTAFYDGEPVMLGKSACYFNVLSSLDKHFIRYYLETKEYIDYANLSATGSTIKNLSLKAMRNLPLQLPSLPEQQEIVRILDSLLEKEQRTHELCDIIEKIDMMKKAILALAFRGELGTNDPSEEKTVEFIEGDD